MAAILIPVPNRRTYILWAILVGSLPSCGGGGEVQTCLTMTITYSGSKSGRAYIKIVSDDGGRSLSIAGPERSIQDLMLIENGSMTCFGGGPAVDVPFTGEVWIDASGTGVTNCSQGVLTAQCEPASTDPRAHQSAVMRYGQQTQIRFDVVDPP